MDDYRMTAWQGQILHQKLAAVRAVNNDSVVGLLCDVVETLVDCLTVPGPPEPPPPVVDPPTGSTLTTEDSEALLDMDDGSEITVSLDPVPDPPNVPPVP